MSFEAALVRGDQHEPRSSSRERSSRHRRPSIGRSGHRGFDRRSRRGRSRRWAWNCALISHVSSAQAKPLIRFAPELCAEIRISHRLLNRISEALVEGIAEAPDRADGVGAAALVEGFPQAAHENIDRALIYVGVLAPDIGEKLLSVEYAPRRLHQVFEKAELGRAEMNLLPGPPHAPRLAVEFE